MQSHAVITKSIAEKEPRTLQKFLRDILITANLNLDQTTFNSLVTWVNENRTIQIYPNQPSVKLSRPLIINLLRKKDEKNNPLDILSCSNAVFSLHFKILGKIFLTEQIFAQLLSYTCPKIFGDLFLFKFEILMKSGMDINIKLNNDHYQNTVLHRLIINENKETIQTLSIIESYNKLFDLTVKDVNGNTPLMLALFTRQSKVVEKILAFPKNGIDDKNNDNQSPLWVACTLGDIESTKLLLTHGAKINFDPTCEAKNKKTIEKLLLKYSMDPFRDTNVNDNHISVADDLVLCIPQEDFRKIADFKHLTKSLLQPDEIPDKTYICLSLCKENATIILNDLKNLNEIFEFDLSHVAYLKKSLENLSGVSILEECFNNVENALALVNNVQLVQIENNKSDHNINLEPSLRM